MPSKPVKITKIKFKNIYTHFLEFRAWLLEAQYKIYKILIIVINMHIYQI